MISFLGNAVFPFDLKTTMSSERLPDHHALITGGGSGIGQAIAVRFAREGAKVSVFDINEEEGARTVESIRQEGGEAACFQGNVGDFDSVCEGFAKAKQRWGDITTLVNNAGIAHIGSLLETDLSDFERVMNVNVKGVFHCMKAAVPDMVARKRGVILNLASIASHLGISDRFAYSAGKGAVLTMTLSVARDYIGHGIRCNCICPARVHTPFVDNYLQKHYPGEEEAMFAKLSAYQPIGRMAEPAEIANLALFLCSDEAAFITGTSFDIDGGVTRLR